MKLLRKVYGGLNMTWPKTIIFAVVIGIYTGAVLMVPALKDTSFTDIGVTFEMWVLLALVVILNCKKPLEAAAKTFVFFLISQPLVYLTQAPFAGLSLLRTYYPNWIIPTILTFPGAFLAWYVKKNNWVSGVILGLGCSIVVACAASYAVDLIVGSQWPHHVLTVLVCLIAVIVLPVALLSATRDRLISWGVTLVALAVALVMMLPGQLNTEMQSSISASVSDCAVADDPQGVVRSVSAEDGMLTVVAAKYGKAVVRCDSGADAGRYQVLSYKDGDSRTVDISRIQ